MSFLDVVVGVLLFRNGGFVWFFFFFFVVVVVVVAGAIPLIRLILYPGCNRRAYVGGTTETVDIDNIDIDIYHS